MEHNRIDEAMAAMLRALDAKDALPADASLDEQFDAAIAGLTADKALLHALAREPQLGEVETPPQQRRGAQSSSPPGAVPTDGSGCP
jgi:hypothetical protein